jgi:hypothetical protein
MIVTDRFVFLHLHKSGGTFVNQALLRFVASARQIGYQLPRSMVPPQYTDLPLLGLVRNPWSYYVSWYSFQARRTRQNPLFLVLSEGGRLGFADTLRNMLDLGAGGRLLNDVQAALPAAYTNRGLNLPGFALEPLRASGCGFYSFLYRYLYEGAGLLHIGRMEYLRHDLVSMLAAVGQPVSSGMHAYITAEPAKNVSDHKAYTSYYDASLRDLVAERDAEVIARHAYSFG